MFKYGQRVHLPRSFGQFGRELLKRFFNLSTDTLKVFPSALEADDIEDFCQLAQYYASRTPQSFRRVKMLLIVCCEETIRMYIFQCSSLKV